MNRKQVLKEMKKNKRKQTTNEEENYINSFVFALLSLIIVIVAGYLFIGVFVTKSITFGNKKEEKKEEINIDNDTILLGQLFNQKDDSYYVLVYDASDDKSILTSWKGIYEGKENALKVYVVDSSNKLNSKFLVEKDSNKNPTSYDDLKVKAPSLIKVENKSVTEYTEGEEEIKNIFKK